MQFSRRFFLTLFLGCFVTAGAEAITLDWDTVTWTAGSLSNSYDIDGSRAGNDITITVSGNTTQFQQELASGNPMTPAITPDFEGGLGTAQNSLCLAVNFANQSQAVTVAVNFSALYTLGVQNVSFTLFDIDYSNVSGNQYQDLLSSIQAVDMNGNAVAATITTSANNTRTGTGLTQVVNGTVSTADTGPGSGNGNVTISFGATAIKSFTFTYGTGGPSGVTDPTYQHVGISDITFTPVPELNPAWSAVGSCLIAAVLILRHSAKFRK